MRPSALPDPLSTRPFSRREALELGVTLDRLRADGLTVPYWGVRSSRPPGSTLERARCFLPLLRDDEFFSHVTALDLWGLPLPRRRELEDLHVAATASRQRRRVGVVGHRAQHGTPRLVVDGCPASAPVEAWVQSATLLGLDELVVVGDALLGSWSARAEARRLPGEQLTAAVGAAHHRRRPCRQRLDAALSLVRQGVMSPKETALRLLVVRAGLPEPEINVPRRTRHGDWLGTPDLSYGRQRIAVEYEGDHHRSDRRQWRRDIERCARFVDDGWAYHRVTDDHLAPPLAQGFLRRLSRDLHERR
jgi:hypothetical protein